MHAHLDDAYACKANASAMHLMPVVTARTSSPLGSLHHCGFECAHGDAHGDAHWQNRQSCQAHLQPRKAGLATAAHLLQ